MKIRIKAKTITPAAETVGASGRVRKITPPPEAELDYLEADGVHKAKRPVVLAPVKLVSYEGGKGLTTDGPRWNLYEDGITQSLLGRFLECPEKLRLSMIAGLTPVRLSGAFAFGSLVHEALDRVYSLFRERQSGSKEPLPYAAIVTYLRHILEQLETKDRQRIAEQLGANPEALAQLEETHGIASILVTAYFKQWAGDYFSHKWVSLEQMFEVSVQSPATGRYIPVRGKFDGIYRGSNGKLWLFETKTKSRVEDDVISDRMQYDLQVMLYLWAMQQVYQETPVGVCYNVLRKPGLRQTKSENLKQFLTRIENDVKSRNSHYFIRYEASILSDEMQLFKGELEQMILQLESWYTGAFHFRNSGSCQTRYGTCEFFPVCSRNDYTYIKQKELVFPELTQAEGVE